MTARKTDPEKNRCRACGYAWYPAGIERALACPRCGSEEIAYAWTERWPAYLGCLAIAAFLAAATYSAIRIGAAYFGW